MSPEDQLLHYVQLALDRREAGEIVDLDELCADHPELARAVAEALEMDDHLPAAMPLDPLRGTVIDERYALEEWIGAGAMGVVYEGTDRSLERTVAIKVLQQGILATEQRQQRFVREARVLATLNHPNIVRVHDHGRSSGGFHYIVMERLTGVSLAAVLETQMEAAGSVRLPSVAAIEGIKSDLDWLPQVATWGAQLASALSSAHAVGVFHRDLKPSNIFIDATGRAVLLDFGIATREGDGSLTVGGTTLGTPWYMAPEQALNPSSATAQLDVYGLAATIYHLVTLRPPYDGDYAQVLTKLQSEEPVPPGFVRRELPRDLCAIIEKGMERDPRRRYADMQSFARDLRAFLAHLPVEARPLSSFGRRLRRIKARPMPAIVTATLLVAIVTTVLVTSAWRDAARRELESQNNTYRTLVASLPPSVAIEGSLRIRPLLNTDERSGYIDDMGQILAIRPGDVYTRALRSALYLDHGEHDSSAADIRVLAESAPDSPYLRALVKRYDEANVDVRGAEAVDLANLPEPQTKMGRFMAGFHAVRLKDSATAEQYLAPAADFLPARYLRLGVRANLANARSRSTDQSAEFEAIRKEARDLASALGHDTARTNYFLGSASIALKEWTSAIYPLTNAVALSPSFGSLFNLALAYRKVGRLEEARELYGKAAKLRPWNLNAMVQLAQITGALGKFDEAMTIAEAIPETGFLVEPWHRRFVMGWVESLRFEAEDGQGETEKARETAQRAVVNFKAALADVPASDRSRSLVLGSLSDAELFLDRRPEYLESMMLKLRKDPLSPLYLRAVAAALVRFELSAELRDEVRRGLLAVADALRSSRMTAAPTEASAKKKK